MFKISIAVQAWRLSEFCCQMFVNSELTEHSCSVFERQNEKVVEDGKRKMKQSPQMRTNHLFIRRTPNFSLIFLLLIVFIVIASSNKQRQPAKSAANHEQNSRHNFES